MSFLVKVNGRKTKSFYLCLILLKGFYFKIILTILWQIFRGDILLSFTLESVKPSYKSVPQGVHLYSLLTIATLCGQLVILFYFSLGATPAIIQESLLAVLHRPSGKPEINPGLKACKHVPYHCTISPGSLMDNFYFF